MLRDIVFELRLALRLLFIKPRGFYRIARFFTIATLGIGVAALLLSLSAFDGYRKVISERYLDSNSHIIVTKRFFTDEDLKQKVQSIIGKDIKASAYSGYLELMLSSGMGIKGSAFQVVEPDSFDSVIPLSKYMKEGSPDCVFKAPDNMIVGSALAEDLGLKTGDSVVVIYLKASRKLKVCGISEYGLYDIDSRLSWISYSTAKSIFPEADLKSSLKIRLNDTSDLDTVMERLIPSLAYMYEARSWKDINYGMLESIKLDRLVIFFILGILIAVAVFNVFATLVILIRELRTEISVLTVLGLNAKRTLRMFFMQAIVLGVSGYLLGIVMWITSLLIVKEWGVVKLPKDVYLVSQIPVGVNTLDLLYVFLMVILFVSLASAAPLMHLFSKFKKEGSTYGVKGQWAQ